MSNSLNALTYLNDVEIEELCVSRNMVTPFVANLAEKGVVSYGLTSSGYDIRSAPLWKRSHPITKFLDYPVLADVKEDNSYTFVTLEVLKDDNGMQYVALEPQGFFLTHSLEKFQMPDDVVGTCVGKSTWARIGIDVLITPLEPGWCGSLVIEVVNESKNWVKMYVGEGLAQIRFTRINKPRVSYRDRGGKYQNQEGITHSMVVSSE